MDAEPKYDVFVSYQSEDRDRVRTLVEELQRHGRRVWWDREIGAGQRWDSEIEDAIAASRSVLVVWSRTSIASKWVRAEAAEGDRRGALVPILIDEVEPPLQFRHIQTVPLIGYRAGRSHPGAAAVVDAVDRICSGRELRPDQGVTRLAATGRSVARRGRALLIVGGAVVFLAAALVLNQFRKSSPPSSESRSPGTAGGASQATASAALPQRAASTEPIAAPVLERVLEGHKDQVLAVCFSQDDSVVISGGEDAVANVWQVSTGDRVFSFREHKQGIYAVASSPDGTKVVSGGRDKKVLLWDRRPEQAGRGLGTIPIPVSSLVHELSYAPDGTFLAMALDDEVTFLAHGISAPPKPIAKGKDWIYSVGISPDSKLVAVGARNNSVRIFSTRPTALLHTLRPEGEVRPAFSLRFSPDGGLLAVAGWGAIELWETGSGRLGKRLTGGTSYVYAIAFLLSGQKLISGEGDGAIRIWDVPSGRLERIWPAHREMVTALAVSHDGSVLATAGQDHLVKLWRWK